MIKVLLLIFENTFGQNSLYISQDYYYYKLTVGDVSNETIYDYNKKQKFIKVKGKFILDTISPSLKKDIQLELIEEYPKEIEFLGYNSILIEGKINYINYNGYTKCIYSKIPVVDSYNLKIKKHLPIVFKADNGEIYYRTYLAESHDSQFGNDSIILDKLISVKEIEVDSTFFTSKVNDDF